MNRSYVNIAFTPAIKALQVNDGSRGMYEKVEHAAEEQAELGLHEKAFIAARDSFYLASVSETGWPYVQHRGGPEGFLKVLDDRSIGFADFRGNRQLLSVGNLQGNDRVALIMVDYEQRRRLKIYGRAKLLQEAVAPQLISRLIMPNYPAKVERVFVISVEAWSWNCPQHITPRYKASPAMAG